MADVRRRFLEVPAYRPSLWEVEFNHDYQYFKEYQARLFNLISTIAGVFKVTSQQKVKNSFPAIAGILQKGVT